MVMDKVVEDVHYGVYRNPDYLYFSPLPTRHEMMRMVKHAIELQKAENKRISKAASLARKDALKA